MGGVKPFDSDADDNALLEPDTAQNNTFCMESATYLYRRCQELGVPLVILTRHSAYRCPMPRSVYDRMARTGNPIGIHLQKGQVRVTVSVNVLGWGLTCARRLHPTSASELIPSPVASALRLKTSGYAPAYPTTTRHGSGSLRGATRIGSVTRFAIERGRIGQGTSRSGI